MIGVLFLGYGAAVYFWHDPVTDLYARWKQHQLSGQLEKEITAWQNTAAPETQTPVSDAGGADALAAKEGAVRNAARTFYAGLQPGQALGRIIIPKLGIDPVFVNGTSWGGDLSRGPGRYRETSIPGLGKVTAIAGHRTTFGAWFRHIDDLEAGDPVALELPYGTFHYRVAGHEIVKNDDWSIIKPRGYEALVLSACHPLYSASHRWVVYARLTKVDMPNGQSYRLPAPATAAA